MRAQGSLEESLEYCLQELMRTGDVEASLQGDPLRAEQLRPLLQAAQAAHRYYTPVPEAPGGLVAGRERLLALAAERRARGPATGPPTEALPETWRRRIQRVFPARLIRTMLALALSVALLGGAVVAAAGDSLPGDLLYPVKLATEDVRLALPSTAGGQVNLALEFVNERGEEIQALVASGRPVPDQAVARMERHMDRALTQAAWADEEETEGLLLRIARRSRAQAQQLEQLQVAAPGPARAGLARAVAVSWQGAQAAEAGLEDPATFRWRYRHRHGEPEPTAEPEQNQERRQRQNQEREGENERTPTATPQPHATRPGQRETATLQPSRRGSRATPTPQATPGSATPTVSPSATLQSPRATSEPTATPHGPLATAGPHATSHGPGATATPPALHRDPGETPGPSVTPQGPAETAGPQATSGGPRTAPGNPSATPQSSGPGGGHGAGP